MKLKYKNMIHFTWIEKHYLVHLDIHADNDDLHHHGFLAVVVVMKQVEPKVNINLYILLW